MHQAPSRYITGWQHDCHDQGQFFAAEAPTLTTRLGYDRVDRQHKYQKTAVDGEGEVATYQVALAEDKVIEIAKGIQ